MKRRWKRFLRRLIGEPDRVIRGVYFLDDVHILDSFGLVIEDCTFENAGVVVGKQAESAGIVSFPPSRRITMDPRIQDFLERQANGEILCGRGVVPCAKEATHLMLSHMTNPDGTAVCSITHLCSDHAPGPMDVIAITDVDARIDTATGRVAWGDDPNGAVTAEILALDEWRVRYGKVDPEAQSRRV